MSEEMSVADVMALNGNGGFGTGCWFWIIILLFLFGGWGNYGRHDDSRLDDEFIKRDIFNNQNAILTSGAENVKTTLQTGYDNTVATMRAGYDNTIATMKAGYDNTLQTLQNRYDTLLGFKDAQYQNSQCCCEIKTQMAAHATDLAKAIHDEGEATRALITSNTIQELRDSLQAAQLTLGNANQTQNLINALRPYPAPAYITASPYTSACLGCGCNSFGA